MKATEQDIQEFFEVLDSADIYYRNYGGCLFFCYVFVLWLQKCGFDTTSFRIVQYDYEGKYKINHNLRFIEGLEDNAESAPHYTWLYDDKEFDSDGECERQYYPSREVLNGLDNWGILEEFCVNALNNGGWNNTFNRNHAISVLEDEFNIPLSHVAL